MRRFYCGPEYGISTDALSYTEVTCHYVPGDRVASPTKLSSFDAQISPNPPSLILRFQHIMSMRSIASTVHDEDYDDVDQAYFALFQICKHTLETFWMQCITRNSYRSKCSRCEYCNIDYDVQIFENRPDDHVTAVVTSWINLGSGLSSDDPRWKFHTFDCVWGKEEEEEEEEAFRKDSSPRFAFETITDIPLRDLTSRNLSYLKDKRYQSVMAPIHGSVPAFWALWNGAAMPSSLVAY
ncbi:uncharacterized protein PGRI_086760 [Penicillium griseofulvum]|uniref:Uncharacterized protein n=1 Tax=Penicillium patulum TaxID=5078 RepID=A0A135LTV8_PENPA|nr:uncharacterized protein PGRI_086760 [Penicillium griseofulvum]KXG52392.1 hypothetical protein PGRI_086760 [Penicillium griseofulvum]